MNLKLARAQSDDAFLVMAMTLLCWEWRTHECQEESGRFVYLFPTNRPKKLVQDNAITGTGIADLVDCEGEYFGWRVTSFPPSKQVGPEPPSKQRSARFSYKEKCLVQGGDGGWRQG